MIGIYKITSPSNKIYIGQTTNYIIRCKNYRLLRCKNQTKLYRSFLKYGYINHIFEFIEECDINLLNKRERYWQEFYNVVSKNGLNCRLTETNDKSGKLSDETKKRMSISAKGKIVKTETKLKMSISQTGKKLSNQTKLKMSNSFKNKLKKGKTVVCTESNQIWESAKKASISLNLNYPSLLKQLSGIQKNKTTLIYYNYDKFTI